LNMATYNPIVPFEREWGEARQGELYIQAECPGNPVWERRNPDKDPKFYRPQGRANPKGDATMHGGWVCDVTGENPIVGTRYHNLLNQQDFNQAGYMMVDELDRRDCISMSRPMVDMIKYTSPSLSFREAWVRESRQINPTERLRDSQTGFLSIMAGLRPNERSEFLEWCRGMEQCGVAEPVPEAPAVPLPPVPAFDGEWGDDTVSFNIKTSDLAIKFLACAYGAAKNFKVSQVKLSGSSNAIQFRVTEDASGHTVWTLHACRDGRFPILEGTAEKYERTVQGSFAPPVSVQSITLKSIRHPEYRRAGNDVLAPCAKVPGIETVADLDNQFMRNEKVRSTLQVPHATLLLPDADGILHPTSNSPHHR